MALGIAEYGFPPPGAPPSCTSLITVNVDSYFTVVGIKEPPEIMGMRAPQVTNPGLV